MAFDTAVPPADADSGGGAGTRVLSLRVRLIGGLLILLVLLLLLILLVLAVIFGQAVQALPALWMSALIYLVVLTTVWSGFGYVWTWGRKAWLSSKV